MTLKIDKLRIKTRSNSLQSSFTWKPVCFSPSWTCSWWILEVHSGEQSCWFVCSTFWSEFQSEPVFWGWGRHHSHPLSELSRHDEWSYQAVKPRMNQKRDLQNPGLCEGFPPCQTWLFCPSDLLIGCCIARRIGLFGLDVKSPEMTCLQSILPGFLLNLK